MNRAQRREAEQRQAFLDALAKLEPEAQVRGRRLAELARVSLTHNDPQSTKPFLAAAFVEGTWQRAWAETPERAVLQLAYWGWERFRFNGGSF